MHLTAHVRLLPAFLFDQGWRGHVGLAVVNPPTSATQPELLGILLLLYFLLLFLNLF